ncbi:translation repressor/antiviral protein Ski3 [Aulographum hederae CBS 113979]|uniref:Translation repressor/antiviral protein Ski3 n=1 Tax=Aulographum hederae CBS 113979 TaxID=1176131 RepID=A0A6G1GJ29_9PEZI|nr:translation repressor/antiviral protein Ski3 [Aulographum hederae CBS 113979]
MKCKSQRIPLTSRVFAHFPNSITVTFSIADFGNLNGEEQDEDLNEDPALYDDPSDYPTAQSGGANSKGATPQGKTSGGNIKVGQQENGMTEEEEDELAREEEEQASFPVRLSITVVKPSSKSAGSLAVDAIAQDGEIIIENMYHYPDAALADPQTAEEDWKRKIMYTGPPFGNLDEDLQVLMERFLEERGINTELAVWVPEFVDKKEASEYRGWLGRVKGFFDPKAALKAAKAALDAQKYDEVVSQAQAVLAQDKSNYFANLFLGRAYDKLGDPIDAANSYEAATKLKPEDPQAWIGLQTVYEAQDSKKVDEYISISLRLAAIYAEADDAHKCQTVADKLLSFAKKNGSRQQHKRALETQLPSSPVYTFLEGRLPHPSHTYTRLAEITEAEEKERINQQIGERRTRLGARIGKVTSEVRLEVYGSSKFEEYCQSVIDWTQDDEVRRAYEEKLFQRAFDTLVVLPSEKKTAKREQVFRLAHGMVIVKHPFALAWDLDLKWKDAESLFDYDEGVLREYIEFFPENGLSKVLKAYLESDASPFLNKEPKPKSKESTDTDDEEVLTPADRLLLMTEGLELAKNSILAHRLMCAYYSHIEEFESAVQTSRNGLRLVAAELQSSGLPLQNTFDALHSTLATALVHYQPPKNHPEAKALFDSILKRKPTFTPALIGVGLILEEQEEYSEAIDFLGRALARDPDNVRIGAEAAWCKALSGEHQVAMTELEKYLSKMKTGDASSRDLRAQTLYRIGICEWETDPTRASRKDRKGPYARFLAAVKTNMNFAPAYTSLGFYYEDYARDKKRARQCFQKAFELSASEVEAAERLARSYADKGDWDIVEIISQRVVDSGKVRPPPGSKKKGISWPFSALGVVQMNKQEYNKSIISFLSALKISPDDYHSYVGLGESYHNSGRYNSAARAFHYAESPGEGVVMQGFGDAWFTSYMLANVNREMGEFKEAVEGYEAVLEDKPNEFGVAIALLQCLVEYSWRSVETGFFGQAIQSAARAIEVAIGISEYRPDAFNLWKAVGDACSVFSVVQSRVGDMELAVVKNLLENSFDTKEFDLFKENDGIGSEEWSTLARSPDDDDQLPSKLAACLHAAILAHKRAIFSCSHDVHAQAVAWYNLGWTEFRAHVSLEQQYASDNGKKKPLKFLKASMRCFKRAIELEAGNSEFWNSLGVITTHLNPKVAQHSFIRSLHINERNARTWTNLGVLYMLENDYELAHQAFSRAQSTDPEYAHAWLGEGILALLYAQPKEALLHFTHAFEIAPSENLVARKQFSTSTFDTIMSPSSTSSIFNLIQPLFALQQLHSLCPSDESYQHLSSLFLERVGAYTEAIVKLSEICVTKEAEYETSESADILAKFAQAKADLARNRLAANDFSSAIEDAETALGLTEPDEDDSGGVAILDEGTRKVRLSAHLTVGLANFNLKDSDAALAAFRSALTESHAAPDIVCLLAQVLWAKGGKEEKSVAREQLFDTVEKHTGHVGVLTVLGSIVTLEGDVDGIEAVKDELEALRSGTDLGAADRKKVEMVLDAIAALAAPDHLDPETAELYEVQKSIMISPSASDGWTQLAELTANDDVDGTEEHFHAAELALMNAKRSVPPRGETGPEELSKVYEGTGKLGDTLRGLMVAPWRAEGWIGLGAAVESIGVEGRRASVDGGVKL